MSSVRQNGTGTAIGAGILGIMAGVCATESLSQQSASYPSRPVRLVAPFPAGGVLDFFARVTAQKLSERVGQQVVVETIEGDNAILTEGPDLGTAVVTVGAAELMGAEHKYGH